MRACACVCVCMCARVCVYVCGGGGGEGVMTKPVYTWLGVGMRMPQHRKLTTKGSRKSEQNYDFDDFVEDEEEGEGG